MDVKEPYTIEEAVCLIDQECCEDNWQAEANDDEYIGNLGHFAFADELGASICDF